MAITEINFLVLIIVLFYFIISSIEDIKKREVYDYINFSLTFLIIIIAIFNSILISSLDPIKYVGFGILIGFALGSLLYYVGIWGGGDAKFLIGFSAAAYYLAPLTSSTSAFQVLYLNLEQNLTLFFSMFLNFFLNYILFLDALFLMIIILAKIFYIKKTDKFNSTYLFLILFFLMNGLYFNFSIPLLILIGFIVFVMIFFAKEDLFLSVYFTIKKNVFDLGEKNKITKDIVYEKEKIVDYENSKFALTKEDLINIKTKIKKGFDIDVKKIFPLSTLITLNYLMYIFKVLSLDITNIQILSFLTEFLFLSFICGGILAVSMIVISYVKNHKKIKINFSRTETTLLVALLIIILLSSIIDLKLLLFLFFLLIYVFIKLSKEVERFMFVKKKDIDKIVLGDWIYQDIYHNDKLIYSVDQFKLGIDENQLARIKELSKIDKGLKNIYVKDGIAFLPPLFLGFLILLL